MSEIDKRFLNFLTKTTKGYCKDCRCHTIRKNPYPNIEIMTVI